MKQETIISVTGLGYVGAPIAVAFAKHFKVIAFDTNQEKIKKYQKGIEPTLEIGEKTLKESSVKFTSKVDDLKEANFHIVAVPTPIRKDNYPDLGPLIRASENIGKILKKGDYVIYESTVYPGTTEEVCIPLLEKNSNLKIGYDFKVGYSPERINPGDKIHRLENIKKIVSASDDRALKRISNVYQVIINAGIHEAPSIKVAEAAKIIENSQRDINIAFMNELSQMFDVMKINTWDVLEAANTKWNFLDFTPGLVGGHCIGVDPFYLTYKAELMGYHSKIVLAGRQINDNMGDYVVSNIIKKLIQNNINVKDAKICILGITFKENTSDIRNTRVVDIISGLKEYGITVDVCDPMADKKEVKIEYNQQVIDLENVKDNDLVIYAIDHDCFHNIDILDCFGQNCKILIDIKGRFNYLEGLDDYWTL